MNGVWDSEDFEEKILGSDRCHAIETRRNQYVKVVEECLADFERIP